MKKMLKTAVICGALILTACAPKDGGAGTEVTAAETTAETEAAAETTAETEAAAETTAETETAAETEAAAETAAEPETAEQETDAGETVPENIVGADGAGIRIIIENPGIVTGEVTDVGMSTVTVRSEVDGEEYTFSREDAETYLEDGLVVGGFVEVVYSGVPDGTDTTGVQVLLIQDNIRKTITGTVVDEEMSTIRIETEDGRELTFSKELAESDRPEGSVPGAAVTLEYTGEIFDGDDTQFAFVWKISDAD